MKKTRLRFVKVGSRERIRLSRNPCTGRTATERKYIQRCLVEIADDINYHLDGMDDVHPLWLPEAVITPTSESFYVDTLEDFQRATLTKGPSSFLKDLSPIDIRATNRVRVATWYEKEEEQGMYMVAQIIVSPLKDRVWGALPLTQTQWATVMPAMTAAHMHWKWIHAVRQYWSDDEWQTGGVFGWYMEPCKRLTSTYTEKEPICTGQAIYSHVVRKYSDHALKR